MFLVTEEMLGIDNKLPEYKTFCVVENVDGEESVYYTEFDFITGHFTKEVVDRVLHKIADTNGEPNWMGFNNPGTPEYFEIQWD